MMQHTQVDRCIRFMAVFMIAGIACWFGPFALSGFMLFGLGVFAANFTNWKTERGLWMLALLYFFIYATLYVFFTIDQAKDLIAGKAQLLTLSTVDLAIGSSVLGYTVRFLWAVFRYNRRIRTNVVALDVHNLLNPEIEDA